MTELVDLITDPKERMTEVFDKFINRLEAQHKQDEASLDRMYEAARLTLHRRQLKTVYTYKRVLDNLFIQFNKDKDATILDMFERVLRAKDKAPYTRVFSNALPALEKLEQEGGHIEVAIKHHEASRIQSGSCLFADHPDGHFSFIDEELDGFDDFYEYKVTRIPKNEKARKEAEETRMKEMRLSQSASEPPKNEVVLNECGAMPHTEPDFIQRILQDLNATT